MITPTYLTYLTYLTSTDPSQFTIKNIRAGLYDIRYRDLDSGSLSKSESFVLEEIKTYDGVEYSNLTMTLYKIQNGNMQTYGLSEEQF